jgi:opacity protein-like surface antigen
MGLSYLIQKALDDGDSSATDKQGPAISATVPIGTDLSIGATYAYTRSDSIADLERQKNSGQTVGLTAGWDVGAAVNADVKVKAKYDYSRDTSTTGGDKQSQHAATVGMDMKF